MNNNYLHLFSFISEKQFAPENPPPYTDNSAENENSGGKSGRIDGVAPLHAGAPIVMPVVVETKMGPKPAAMVCPSCREQIITRVEQKSTTKTHLFAGLLCILG